MHHRRQQQLVLVALAVLLFAGSFAVALAGPTWALTAGEEACPTLPYCAASYDACTAYAPGSYFTGADSPPFLNATSPTRQLAAAPFRFEGEGSFEVQGLSMIFSRKTDDAAVFNLAVLFYEADATNSSLPGDVLPGWEGGRAVQVTISRTVSPTGPTIAAPFFRVTGAITPSFNLSAGTYFLSVASFGSKPSTTDGAYRIAGSNTTGASFAAYLGIQPRGTVYPALALNATDAWTIPVRDVLACVWPTGTEHRPQGSNTTNTTTTTTGGNTTTTAGTTTTTGGNTTTTGGSGGGSNPTDYLVRYPLATDLNSLSPAGFISGVTATLQLPPDAQIEIVAARRAQVTTTTTSSSSSSKRASVAAQQQEQGTLLDFFVSGADGASFMEKALSAKLADLRANNVSIASAPTTVTADASSGALLRPAALVSLVVDYLRLSSR